MLKSVVDDGTGKVIRRRGLKGEVIGKTGTSSDYRDSWFCGATPDLVVVVWVGYDDNRSMYTKNDVGVVGATGAAPIWADFMIRATAGQPLCNFHRPPGVITLFMDPVTGIVSNLPEKSDWIPVTLKEEDADILLEQSRREMEADSSANLEKELIEENVEGTE